LAGERKEKAREKQKRSGREAGKEAGSGLLLLLDAGAEESNGEASSVVIVGG
jgi:hypothetical protein